MNNVVETPKAKLTLRFWKASLAWKNIDDWAKGWTAESFIKELRVICNDNGRLGGGADSLLDDMIHDRERTPNDIPGELIRLQFLETTNIGQAIQA